MNEARKVAIYLHSIDAIPEQKSLNAIQTEVSLKDEVLAAVNALDEKFSKKLEEFSKAPDKSHPFPKYREPGKISFPDPFSEQCNFCKQRGKKGQHLPDRCFFNPNSPAFRPAQFATPRAVQPRAQWFPRPAHPMPSVFRPAFSLKNPEYGSKGLTKVKQAPPLSLQLPYKQKQPRFEKIPHNYSQMSHLYDGYFDYASVDGDTFDLNPMYYGNYFSNPHMYPV